MAGTPPALHRDVVLGGVRRVQVHAADGGGGVPGSVRAAWPGAVLVGVLDRSGSAQPAGDGDRGVAAVYAGSRLGCGEELQWKRGRRGDAALEWTRYGGW